MGATLSLEEHDETQLKTLQDAQEKWLEHCNAKDIVREEWIDLPDDEALAGLKQLHVYQIGSKDPRAPLILFIHGGGGVPLEFADLFTSLETKFPNKRIWFLERPGHGTSKPFDYFSVETKIHEHAVAFVDAVRQAAGVEQMDLCGNSAGGWHLHYYAKAKPQCVRTLVWLGVPACFKGQPLPFSITLLGSWIGTQIMARPPPRAVAEDLCFNFHRCTKDQIPECYVDMYMGFMSLRNNSLSWNYWLRSVTGHKDLYYFELETLNEAFSGGNKFDCHFILGGRDTFITEAQIEMIEQQFGKPAVRVPTGGHLPWHGNVDMVVQELANIWK